MQILLPPCLALLPVLVHLAVLSPAHLCAAHRLVLATDQPAEPLRRAGVAAALGADEPASLEEMQMTEETGTANLAMPSGEQSAIASWKDADTAQCKRGDGKKGVIGRCKSAILRWSLQELFSPRPWNSSTWGSHRGAVLRPPQCDFLSKEEGTFIKTKQPCEVFVLAPEKFVDFAGLSSVTTSILESVKAGPLVKIDPGAGKSGAKFMKSIDEKLFFKFGLRDSEVTILEGMMGGFYGKKQVRSLLDHFGTFPKSLLNQFHAVMKFRIPGYEGWVLTMADISHGLARIHAKANDSKYWAYDLKGKSRSPKQRSKKGAQTGQNGDFAEREKNGLAVAPKACQDLTRQAYRDLKFLDQYDAIDYSLYVGHLHSERVLRGMDSYMASTEHPGHDFYTVSIMDFLVPLWYSNGKKVESALRRGKFSRYGQKTAELFNSTLCLSSGRGEDSPPLPEWDEVVFDRSKALRLQPPLTGYSKLLVATATVSVLLQALA